MNIRILGTVLALLSAFQAAQSPSSAPSAAPESRAASRKLKDFIKDSRARAVALARDAEAREDLNDLEAIADLYLWISNIEVSHSKEMDVLCQDVQPVFLSKIDTVKNLARIERILASAEAMIAGKDGCRVREWFLTFDPRDFFEARLSLERLPALMSMETVNATDGIANKINIRGWVEYRGSEADRPGKNKLFRPTILMNGQKFIGQRIPINRTTWRNWEFDCTIDYKVPPKNIGLSNDKKYQFKEAQIGLVEFQNTTFAAPVDTSFWTFYSVLIVISTES